MEIRVLGPVEVWASGEELTLGSARARTVLAMLALDVDRVVTVDRLVDAMWGDAPPATATGQVHTTIWRLRRLFGDAIERRPNGYRLRVPHGTIDLELFEDRLAAGRVAAAEHRLEDAAAAYGAALTLWRGEALSNVPSLAAEAGRLEELRLAALEGRLEADLALGADEALVGELTELTARYPLRERLHAHLMTALHDCGRSAEALGVYRALRDRLADELGLEPMPDLQELHRKILARERLTPTGSGSSPVGSSELRGEATGQVPETRYISAEGIHVAYEVLGGEEGPDIVLVPGLLSHLDLWWEDHTTAQFMRRLASLGRLILFDKRGTGLSDRPAEAQTLDDRMDDIRLVMDAAGSRRAVLVAYSEGGPMSLMFAATHPERVTGIVLTGAAARWSEAEDYPCGSASTVMFEALETICEKEWGQGNTIEWYAPCIAHSERARALVARRERMSVSPNDFLRMLRMIREIDVRDILSSVNVPVLVFQRLNDRVTPPCHGRFLAARLPNAEYIEEAGDHVIWIGDTEPFLGAVGKFIRDGREASLSPDRVLVTLLSAQAVEPLRRGSSSPMDRLVGALSDRRYVAPGCHPLVKASDEEMLATFDGPVRAIEAALRVQAAASRHSHGVRIGVHVGEAALADGLPTPISAQMTTNLATFGHPGEVLVTRTVRDLVIGAPFQFKQRASAALHPELEPLPIYAVQRRLASTLDDGRAQISS